VEKNYTDAIKQLVAEHYKHDISRNEYRARRKHLIDQMDLEFNGNEFISAREAFQAPLDPSNR
jgi:hypothetical protein